ncbi:MAG: R-phenyllactate dehydratase beta subunit [Syntrophaceae bacterium PtaB.Bin095]|jgi:bzd-type benzoyl-CoA reductase N subunit|nr:MAG: R-phenyllactate dehydratase beta subunit [Syntrophaceae bacterium PtaB.Bin095]
MNHLDEIRQAVLDPYGYAKKYRQETGGKIVGYFCSYAPEEIVWAAGALPFRIFSRKGNLHLADRHLQSYCCSLVRSVLEEALSGELGFLDGVVFPHTCDSIQRLSDIWRLNVPYGFHADVVLPVKLNTESARDYMVDVLRAFRTELEGKLGAPVTDEALKASMGLYDELRGALRRIYEIREAHPARISGADVHAIVKASVIMDRARLATLLSGLVEDLGRRQPDGAMPDRKRIALSGGICDFPDIHSLIDEAGGIVVWDDLCTGARSFAGGFGASADPIEAIAERYLDRIVCPAKHSGLTNRADHLVRMVREKGAQGVVFTLLKFCDPHAFDYPALKNALDREGIPSLLLEVEDQLPPEGQLRTRFETFVEML